MTEPGGEALTRDDLELNIHNSMVSALKAQDRTKAAKRSLDKAQQESNDAKQNERTALETLFGILRKPGQTKGEFTLEFEGLVYRLSVSDVSSAVAGSGLMLYPLSTVKVLPRAPENRQ